MGMSELLDCPFCGGEARLFDISWTTTAYGGHMFKDPFWQVICDKCKAGIGDFNTEAEAIAAWNTRHERTCHIEHMPKNEELRCRSWLACSECGNEIDNYEMKYCPNCGAKVVEQ